MAKVSGILGKTIILENLFCDGSLKQTNKKPQVFLAFQCVLKTAPKLVPSFKHNPTSGSINQYIIKK